MNILYHILSILSIIKLGPSIILIDKMLSVFVNFILQKIKYCPFCKIDFARDINVLITFCKGKIALQSRFSLGILCNI